MQQAATERLALSAEQRVAPYYAELLKDAGCTAWTRRFAAAVVTDEIIARREFYCFNDDRRPLDLLAWLKNLERMQPPASMRSYACVDPV